MQYCKHGVRHKLSMSLGAEEGNVAVVMKAAKKVTGRPILARVLVRMSDGFFAARLAPIRPLSTAAP